MDTLIEQFKKGYKTTEFWVTAATGAIILAEGATGLDLDNEGMVGLVATVAAYVLSRGYLKSKRVDAIAAATVYGETPVAEVPPVG